ncbi:DNA primase [Desulfocucumis palustris]|uniref:DNA primase n=1 Tax=Desulfocucumis palustris TaxID=1898651 RepID=A0A2L2XA05_9FIRM|nr:CHC2 zinc finger domain-containing protein [Desulfocucumis palustris]GBF32882.1 DNA primase [Desulfocucumis palustris]
MSIFDVVKEIPILSVINEYFPDIQLNEYQNYAKGTCPFHEDNDPSFTVYTETNTWHCFGCKLGGSNIDLVMQSKNMDTWEATKELAESWDIPYEELTPEQKAKHEELSQKQKLLDEYIGWAHTQIRKEHREVLRKRGLTDDIIDEYKIGYDPGNKPTGEAELLGFIGNGGGYLPRERIVFPVYHYGKPIYSIFWDYKHTDESKLPKYLLPNRWGKPLIGIDRIRSDSPVYMVEGIFDWFSMIQSGFLAVCAIGTSLSKEKQLILKKAQHIYLLLDNDSQKDDNPGQKAAMDLVKEMFPKAKNIALPNAKDPNELYVGNPENFKNIIGQFTNEAKDYIELLFDKLDIITKDKVANENISSLLNELQTLQLTDEIHKDLIANQLYRKLNPLGVKKKSIDNYLSSAKTSYYNEGNKDSQQDTLLKLAGKAFLFKNNVHEQCVKIKVNDHNEIWRYDSDNFKLWLTSMYYDEFARGPGSDALNSAINTIKAKAWKSDREYKLHNRTAEINKEFWYDLSDKKWRAVKITPEGWEVVSEPPILFQRYSHQQPQPEPYKDGNIKKLLDFINITDPKLKILYLVSVITSFIPDIAHAVFVFHGSEGAGKSIASKVTRRIIDPSASETCNCYDNRGEFTQYMAHNYVIILENLSNIPKTLSDKICAAVTGDGDSKRKLYSNDDDHIYNFKRLFIINGINCVATQADLLRRAILFELAHIASDKRLEERVFWERFNEARPYILGGVFNALSKAMKIYPQIKLQGTTSMADFTYWGYAVAEALGYGGEAFLNAYAENQGRQNDEAIYNNPVAFAVTSLMADKNEWTGTSSNLLEAIEAVAENERIDTRAKSWPKAPNALTRKLNEAKVILQKREIYLDLSRSGTGRNIIITNKGINATGNNEPKDDSACHNEGSYADYSSNDWNTV